MIDFHVWPPYKGAEQTDFCEGIHVGYIRVCSVDPKVYLQTAGSLREMTRAQWFFLRTLATSALRRTVRANKCGLVIEISLARSWTLLLMHGEHIYRFVSVLQFGIALSADCERSGFLFDPRER